PIPASSGNTLRHRLNRFGDRHLNNAFDTIARTRMRHHEPTQAYVQGQYEAKKNYREIKRKLKRYLVKSFFVVYGFLAILRVFQYLLVLSGGGGRGIGCVHLLGFGV